MTESGRQDEREAKRVQEWLLSLLRFAFTLEPVDQAFVLTLAEELDAYGCPPKSARSCFFFRTSAELCAAIERPNYPKRDFILARFLDSIGDPRLKQALSAAINVKAPENSADPEPRRNASAAGANRKERSCRASGDARRARPAARTCVRDLPT